MLQFYNTKAHRLQTFQPLTDHHVRMYGCGPTVYDYAHIGNLRAFIFYDMLRRYLIYKGYAVTFAMNITDVDDKTIRSSKAKGQSLRDYTTFYMQEFFKDWARLDICMPDKVIRATDEIPAMVELIQLLLKKGHAYQTASGDIFFKISSFPSYGQMAGIDASKLRENANGRLSDEYEKEDAQDFALWKAWTPADGDVFWDTEIGKGRPGWHIECSAMSHKYLGQPFDIHTGGEDLIFPHHTNEIAQSECAYGTMFCNFFMHNAFLKVNGQKMSKSLGNFYTLQQLLDKGYSPRAIRYEFIKSHYRQVMDFQENNMAGNQTAVERLSDLWDRLSRADGSGWPEVDATLCAFKTNFEAAMDDDLNTPSALAAVFECVALINKSFAHISAADAAKIQQALTEVDAVLGLLDKAPTQALPAEALALLEKRTAARAAKDWATADALKQQLQALGVTLKDTPTGTIARLATPSL